MLILSGEEIAGLASRDELIAAAERAFRIQAAGEFVMPVRSHVEHGGVTLLSMPCFLPERFGTKLVSLVPGNAQRGVPPLTGIVVLNDGETGQPLALLNGAAITALRTAAVGALSIKFLAGASAARLGVVGAGVQGYNQALFACRVRRFTEIHLFDRQEEALHRLAAKLGAELPGVRVSIAASTAELLAQSQVVITATNSEQPLFPNDGSLFQEKHFVGIGSYKPAMREYPEALFRNLACVLVDTEHALQETGDLITPLQNGWITEEQIVPFHRVVSGAAAGLANENHVTLFKSVGMALFDVVTADMLYTKARQAGCGVEVNL